MSRAAPRVLLVGMMGSGKTTVGRALAARTGWPYLDNDDLVEQGSGRPTPELLAETDESTLRRIENRALEAALAAGPPLVAGVAAGAVLDPTARDRMRENAFVVYLRAPVEVLAARVGSGAGRPWLDGDPAEVLAELFDGREPLYREVADVVVDVSERTPDEIADVILEAVTRDVLTP